MSAIRRSDKRSEARRHNSSPYARPQNSGWSFKKLLEPIRRRVFGQPFEDDLGGRGHQFVRSVSPEDTFNREEDALSQSSGSSDIHVIEPPKSPSATTSPRRAAPVEGSSAMATLENVVNFLDEATGTSLKDFEARIMVSLIQKVIPGEQTVSNSLLQSVGRPLSAIEVEGLISFIRKRMPEGPGPFRFSSSTPSRAGSPFSIPSPTASNSPSTSPKKVLFKNPNGTYRWEGAGSAKQTPRSRNRYASPAFGTTRCTPERMKLKESTSVSGINRHDGKRRKLGEDSSIFPSSSSELKLPFPLTSPSTPCANGINGTGPKISIPSPSRIRTPAIHKPTTPSNPSPLRQAWSGGSSTSQDDLTQPQQPQTTPPKQTKAANIMAELIKEATPPKKPDLSNPYQTASPIAKVGPPRRSARRIRATGRAPLPNLIGSEEQVNASKGKEKSDTEEKEKTKEYPPQAIIEATLPKGSKRSRPPAHFEKFKSPSKSPSLSSDDTSRLSPPAQQEQPVVVETRKVTYFVEEVDDDEEESNRSNKKSKATNSSAPFLNEKKGGPPEISIEIIEDANMQDSYKDINGDGSSSTTSNNSSAIPPTSLNGVQSRPGSSFGGLKTMSIPKEPSKLRYSYQPEGNSTPPSPTLVAKPAPFEFRTPPPPTSASFTFLPPPPPKPAQEPAKSTNSSSPLPSTSKDAEMVEPPDVESEFKENIDPKTKVSSMDRKLLPHFEFILTLRVNDATHAKAQAEAKALPIPSLPTFDFSPEALRKVEKSIPLPMTKSFDWAAAGIKPSLPESSSWTCLTCMLSNPSTVIGKCTVCETLRPSTKAEKPAVKGFDWSAAGIKPPTTQSSSSWTCSTCMLSNPATATDKCTVCDMPR